MDEDTIGYCTKIPSLKEEADRAEAFVHRGIPAFMYACEVANHLKKKCMSKRDEDLALLRIDGYRNRLSEWEHMRFFLWKSTTTQIMQG